jgi:microcin C transport system substrate-binding protein
MYVYENENSRRSSLSSDGLKLEGRMNRRSLLGYTMLAVAALLKWPRSIGTALADDKNWRHGVSLFGDLKYPAGFRHFDYITADVPKGGTAREAVPGTFDNFNGVIAGVRGSARN